MDLSTWLSSPGSALAVPSSLACERFSGEWLGQPANATTSLAFVLAGAAIVLARRGAPGLRWLFGLLVVAVGVGSVVQHGPHPVWQAYAHDLPLIGLLGFVAADAAADLSGRRWRGWWLAIPAVGLPALLVPVIAAGPTASTAAQGVLAVAAIGLNLLRAWRRPLLRGRLLVALALLAAGALAGSLTDRTSLCQPDSLWQGHAAWHLLAAAAMWVLAPAIGARDPRPPTAARHGTSVEAPPP